MVEKFYKVTNPQILKGLKDCREIYRKRNQSIIKFFDEHEIEGDEYLLRGEGFCNCAFKEHNKEKISLGILGTKNNLSNFGNDFKKNSVNGLRIFKKSSKLLKEFQDECIKEEIVINLYPPRMGDYFKELHLGGYSTNLINNKEDEFYLHIHTDRHDSITPELDGFKEIKGSEFYHVKEKIENSEKETA